MSRRRKGSDAPISLFAFQDLITSLSGILILLVLIMSVQLAIQGVVAKPPPVEDPQSQERLVSLRRQAEFLRSKLDVIRRLNRAQGTNDAVTMVRASVQAEQKHELLERSVARKRAVVAEMEKRLARVQSEEQETAGKMSSLQEAIDELRTAQAEALDQHKLFVIPEAGAIKTAVIVECAGTSVRAGYIDRDTPTVTFTTGFGLSKKFCKYLEGLSSEREYIVFMLKPSGVKVFNSLRVDAIRQGFDVGYDALEEDRSIALGSEAL